MQPNELSAKYEGGAISLNSGGVGPDPYLLRRRKPGCRWVRVIVRTGPGQGIQYRSDLDAMSAILRNCRMICVPDNAARYHKMRDRIEETNFTDFMRDNP